MSHQLQLQNATTEFQKLQTEFSAMVEARQRLDTQLTETEGVRKEFANLTPENIVYKQIGPVLVKQDHGEAKSIVKTRLEFIQSEIKRVEGQLKELESKSDVKKGEIGELQTILQEQQQQGSGQQPVAAK